MTSLKRGDRVTLNEDGVRWMVSNPKLYDRWRDRMGVVENTSRYGNGHRVCWAGNKGASESVPAKFLRQAVLDDVA